MENSSPVCVFCAVVVEDSNGVSDNSKEETLQTFYREFVSSSSAEENGEVSKSKKGGVGGGRKWKGSAGGILGEKETVCGGCLPHVKKVVSSKEAMRGMEERVGKLQKEILKELHGVWEEADKMCGELVIIQGILEGGGKVERERRVSAGGTRSRVRSTTSASSSQQIREKVGNALRDLQQFNTLTTERLLLKQGSSKVRQRKTVEPKARKEKKTREVKEKKEDPPEKYDIHFDYDLGAYVKTELYDSDSNDDNEADWLWDNCYADSNVDTDNTTNPTTDPPKELKQGRTEPPKELKQGRTDPPKKLKQGDIDPPNELEQEGSDFETVCVRSRRNRRSCFASRGLNKNGGSKRKKKKKAAEEDDTDDSESSEEVSTDYSDEDFDPTDEFGRALNFTLSMKFLSTFRKNIIMSTRKRNTMSTRKGGKGTSEEDPRDNYFLRYKNGVFKVGDVDVICLDAEQKLQCSRCDFTCSNDPNKPKEKCQDLMFDHILGNHLDAYTCSICKVRSTSYARFKNHNVKVHGPGITCEICGRPLSHSSEGYKTHWWSHLSEEEKADPANQRMKPYRFKHPDVYERRRFQCPTCGKSFRRRAQLQYHEELHGNPEDRARTMCPDCGKVVLQESFRNHKRGYCNKQKGVNCLVCQALIPNSKKLDDHMLKVHPTERPYVCTFLILGKPCGKTFTIKPRLRVHVQTHSDLKNHICPTCGATFKQSKNLNRHKRTCNGIDGRSRRRQGSSAPAAELPQTTGTMDQNNSIWNAGFE